MAISLVSRGKQMKSNNVCNVASDLCSESIDNTDSYIIEDENIDKKKNKEVKEKDIKESIKKLNKFLQGEKTHLEYERHDVFKNQFIVKIVDNKTKKVIKEIPPKKILDMVAEICRLAGVIVDKKA
ncbi:flagellar protein FlaG [Clostridium botulinum]|uniref:flagellar protein FlaG n=1 Tax=Clostridium botulinum TaxID=1491 RepID=UPI000AA6B4B5|nr:flagellar protein FlaG [Clostridium botulinum]